MEFTLTPISKEYYNSQVIISRKRRRIKVLKYDELEIAYFERKGIDIRPHIKGVK